MKSLELMLAQNDVSDRGMCHIDRPNLSGGENQCQSNCSLNHQKLGRSIWGVAGSALPSLIQWVLIKENYH